MIFKTFKLRATGKVIEYKNNNFADVYEVVLEDGRIAGLYYQDGNKKNWFDIFVPYGMTWEEMLRRAGDGYVESESGLYSSGAYKTEKLITNLYNETYYLSGDNDISIM